VDDEASGTRCGGGAIARGRLLEWKLVLVFDLDNCVVLTSTADLLARLLLWEDQGYPSWAMGLVAGVIGEKKVVGLEAPDVD